MVSRVTKITGWLVALCGLWEFGDIAAVFTPGFGEIPAFLWSHILTGLVLMIAGARAALTADPRTARQMFFLSSAAGVWLAAAPFLLGKPEVPAGLWNDFIVGALAAVLSAAAAVASGRSPR